MASKRSMKNNKDSNTATTNKKVQNPFLLLQNDSDHDQEEENLVHKEEVKLEDKQEQPQEQPQEQEQEQPREQPQEQPREQPQVEQHDTEHEEQETDGDQKMLNVSSDVKLSDFVSQRSRDHKFRHDAKYDEKILEHKQIYDENYQYGDIGNELKLNTPWTVWVHKSDNPDWTLPSYQKRYIINSIGSFWRFFNNFQFYDCYKNQLFIMRGEVAPIWEDLNNKFGGICSIKIDSIQRGFKTDISTEIFISVCLLIMNETFIANSDDINGISYNFKKRGILIKIWTKTFHKENKFINELPKQLINKFNTELQKQLMGVMGDDYTMSIQYKQIKPEYEL
jgi:hypothetical protein